VAEVVTKAVMGAEAEVRDEEAEVVAEEEVWRRRRWRRMGRRASWQRWRLGQR
jgi:hypothetical protein